MTNEDCSASMISYGMGAVKDQHICVKAEVGGQSSCKVNHTDVVFMTITFGNYVFIG
jgi:hypothetical protein